MDVEQSSDANLVVAVGRWHEPALAEVYRRHGGAVHALARRILRSDPPAEEVTQEVFLDLWRNPEKFDAQRGTLRSFLLARTHGKSVDVVRAEDVGEEGGEEGTVPVAAERTELQLATLAVRLEMAAVYLRLLGG